MESSFDRYSNIIAAEQHRLELGGEKKRVLLHCCCAPCASVCLERLTQVFSVAVFFFNPNITAADEYRKRADELKRFVLEVYGETVEYIDGDYDAKVFFDMAKGFENAPERGERCLRCYRLRLQETAVKARLRLFNYFCTSLTLSPLKDSEAINAIGESLAGDGVEYLCSDFKKRNGYSRSIELSREHGLYRQNYCGCEFSKRV